MSDGPWWVEPTVTGASIVVGALMLVYQQRAASRAELKLRLFNNLTDVLDAAANAVSAGGMYAFGAIANVRVQRSMPTVKERQAAAPINRIPTFIELHSEAMNRVIAVVRTLETYEIVSEHFELFRRALGCTNQDVQAAFHAASQSMYGVLPVVLPTGPGTSTLFPQPNDPAVATFTEKCEAYWKLTNTLGCYIHDIKIEAQNLLLRGLFRRRVPPRRPADPRLWVLRTDDPEYLCRLRKHFFEDHPVAARNRSLEAEALRAANIEETLP